MRLTVFTAFFFLLASCASTNNSGSSTSSASTDTEQGSSSVTPESAEETMAEETASYLEMKGTIRLSNKGCEQLVELKTESGQLVLLYPMNLDNAFKKNGLEVTFTYKKIAGSLPEGCQAEQLVQIVSMRK